MLGGLSSSERLSSFRDRSSARLGRAQVEYAWLVKVCVNRQQRIPVIRAEQRPDRERAYVHTLLQQGTAVVPLLHQPAHLLLARATVMNLCQRQRQAIALPRFS